MSQAPAGPIQEILTLEVPKPRHRAPDWRINQVESALRPYLPVLAIAHPSNHAEIQMGHTHPDYWIAYFRRPMLRDHAGPLYPPDVAAEIKAILARLDPNQRC
jgi:hypothetical protein